MADLRRHVGLCIALFFLLAFALILPPLYARPRQTVAVEMQVALPRFVQVVMAAGDRYLAANIAGFRTLVATTENMAPENFRIQALVQSDVAWFNPAHEDNYYMAAAFLPWNDQLDAAQYILRSATKARSFDWQPPFYYAFNVLHFLKQPEEGAQWLRLAAQNTTDELQILQLQQLAANWIAKGEDRELAIRIHRAMARETKHKAFAAFLEKRARQMENLIELERAVDRFQQRFGAPPRSLRQLVDQGVIAALPNDPFGMLYVVDRNGRPLAMPAGSGAQGKTQ